MTDDEKTAKFIERQIERAKEAGSSKEGSEFTDLQRDDDGEKVAFSLPVAKKADAQIKVPE